MAAPTTDLSKQDFFISYNKADRNWAEWIAWELEEAGYSLRIQAWHFRPGNNFVLEMHRALLMTERVIIVLSPDFLRSGFTAPELADAFARDPTGEKRLLIPIRVTVCQPEGLLRQVIYIDFADGCCEKEARSRLLKGLQAEGKPKTRPIFPRKAADKPTKQRKPPPAFPGNPFFIRIFIGVSGSELAWIGRHTLGSECVVEVRNLSTLPIDVEGEVEIAHGLLSFPLGATRWRFVIPVNGSTSQSLKIALSVLSQTGVETVTCSDLRYRVHGYSSTWIVSRSQVSCSVRVTQA